MKKNYVQPKAGIHTFKLKVDLLDMIISGSGDGTDAQSKGQGNNQGGSSSMWENMDED